MKYKINMEKCENVGKFFIYIIEILHFEQKKIQRMNSNKNSSNTSEIKTIRSIDKTNRLEVLKRFLDQKINNNYTKINLLFSSVIEMEKKLDNNLKPMFFYRNPFAIEFNLKPIYDKFILKKNHSSFSLNDCFEEWKKEHDTKYENKQCQEKIFLYSTPPCLIITLYRSFEEKFFGMEIKYENEIDLSPFIKNKEGTNHINHIYRLSSVVKELASNINCVNKRRFVTLINNYNNSKVYYYEGYERKEMENKSEFDEYVTCVLIYNLC